MYLERAILFAGLSGAALLFLGCSNTAASSAVERGAPSQGGAGFGPNPDKPKVTPDAGSEAAPVEAGILPKPPPACRTQHDCDDHRACNGIELCIDGACEAGVPYCQKLEAEGCTVTCLEQENNPTCSIAAEDADKDGHGTTLCAAATGDDCDDASETVHPGAQEVCDGVDNDCNGKADLADGLPFGGTPRLLTDMGYGVSIAWSDVSRAFGIVFGDASQEPTALRFRLIDRLGNLSVPTQGDVVDTGGDHRTLPTVVWGQDSFGITWLTRDGEQFRVHFARRDPQGNALEPFKPVTLSSSASQMSPQIGRFTNGDWVLAWEEGQRPNRKIVVTALSSSDFTVTDSVVIGGEVDASEPRIAVRDNEAAVAWIRGSKVGYDRVVSWTRIPYATQAFGDKLEGTLGIEGDNNISYMHAIVSHEAGYAAQWSEVEMNTPNAPASVVSNYGADGRRSCGPTPFDLRAQGDVAPSAMSTSPALVRFPGGFALAGRVSVQLRMSPARLGFAWFDDICNVSQGYFLVTPESGPFYWSVQLSYAADVFALVWGEAGDLFGPGPVRYRLFARNLCSDAR